MMTFDIRQPNGRTLTQYKTGPGPHTGVHLIIVRNDLAYIIHQHPPIPPSGVLHQSVTFPAPGPYHVLVDVYPDIPGGQPNFQLFRNVTVAGAYHPIKLPPFNASPGDRRRPLRHAAPPRRSMPSRRCSCTSTSPTPTASRSSSSPWFGALAHAIFFQEGTLNYFHTHVCAPDAPNCGSLAGAPRISGTLHVSREAHAGRPPARPGDLAAVHPAQGPRPRGHRAVHAQRRFRNPVMSLSLG